MSTYLYLIGFYLFCVIQISTSDICLTCSCPTVINGEPIIDCHEKHLGDNDMLNFDLLTLDEYQAVNKLILSKNNIVNLPRHLLKKLRLLKSLDLSENAMEEIYITMFADLNNLGDLSLSRNLLKSFDDSLMKFLPALHSLNLSYNRIDLIEHRMNKTATKIVTLDLSHNNITGIPKLFFESLPVVQYLDLSFNRIKSLEDCELLQLHSLKVVYLNNNFLMRLNMQLLPKSLFELHVEHNQITELFYDLPYLEVLDISFNEMKDINFTAESLKYLNIAGNMLSNFPNVSFKHLKSLDISSNNITSIPKEISVEYFPLLTQLNISGNPIKDLRIKSELRLNVFVANNMDMLQAIEQDTLLNLGAPLTGCINLTISNNKQLSFIHEDAVKHLNLCSLDLSSNKFTYVSKKLVKPTENFTTYKVNLQGNPFMCNCSSQWMLNDLVPQLYIHQPNLLDNLRCASPPQISNMRMVHWFGWKEEIFCTSVSDWNENLIMDTAGVLQTETVKIKPSINGLITIGVTLTMLIVLVIGGIVWNHRVHLTRRRINRKF